MDKFKTICNALNSMELETLIDLFAEYSEENNLCCYIFENNEEFWNRFNTPYEAARHAVGVCDFRAPYVYEDSNGSIESFDDLESSPICVEELAQWIENEGTDNAEIIDAVTEEFVKEYFPEDDPELIAEACEAWHDVITDDPDELAEEIKNELNPEN